ncbi:sigma-70 family RNA polymerase sigma factor [Mangrovivirga cuniculi]|uniref:RNA polymerase n=1 Tax=Mangrovivirga cuniculi TaxID=2715131 RepID=A0A4D7JVF1_9BACT|nr:sigma-70 family RNA polymerase sigma factor [Mangrovivirga cuniculi]QCK16156.1 RNA polymerase [Mangrovivirga cuniculi]
MSNNTHKEIESNFRAIYGKLFSVLINRFGVKYFNEIEDALQNAFLKSLKTWHAKTPDKIDNWLFIVARNDVINQIKRKNGSPYQSFGNNIDENWEDTDLRLQTILFISSSKIISTQAKVVFILKNIFGLNVREISETTFLSQEAIYKSIKRAKSTLKNEFAGTTIDIITDEADLSTISTVEDILYGVFNIGYDSFNKKTHSIVDEDLCLEALALGKLLYEKHSQVSTKNLLSLFCFHIARIPSKVINGKFIPFFKQDKTKWNNEMIYMGFRYLQKPEELNRYYIEALITSKYMTAESYDTDHWNDIVSLYELLTRHHPSPIVKLNLCYGLYKAKQKEHVLDLLAEIESDLPSGHIYFSLIKAELLREKTPLEADKIVKTVLDKIDQSVRREFILANKLIAL